MQVRLANTSCAKPLLTQGHSEEEDKGHHHRPCHLEQCYKEAGLVREDGTIRKLDRILEADALATIVGALLGTSTTTTYIESGAGIASGGRSGFANVVTAMLFLVAIFVTPFIAIVPSYATAPALVVVGVLMFKSIGRIDFGDFVTAVPAFLTIVLMP